MATHLKNRQRSSYSYFQTYQTRWSDNDQYAHINNSVYYHLFDSVINAFLIQHSTAPAAPDKPIGLVVASHCQFFSPLSFPEPVDLGLRVNKLGSSSVEYEVGVFAHRAHTVSAVGGYTHVFVANDTRRPLVGGIAPALRSALATLHVHDSASDKAKL